MPLPTRRRAGPAGAVGAQGAGPAPARLPARRRTCVCHVSVQPHRPPVLLLHRHVVAGQRGVVLEAVFPQGLQGAGRVGGGLGGASHGACARGAEWGAGLRALVDTEP